MSTQLRTIPAAFALVADGANQSQAVVGWTDRKGTERYTSPEGCLFKGGAALRALQDVAIDSAYIKALGGRYRAAADIFVGAFPKIGSSFDNLRLNPWSCKANFIAACAAVEAAEVKKETDAKGKATKQAAARTLARTLRAELDPPAKEDPSKVIDNGDAGTPPAQQ